MSLYKIILVDDEEEVRDSIKRKVDWNLLGFEVIGSVNNGEEAIELTETNHVDVVLTDIKMPFMDGLTLCAKVKENYKNTKVVLYSGFDDEKFQKDLKRIEKRGYNISLLTEVIKKLANGEQLPEKNKDHNLLGEYGGCRECHITPDWLLIYEIADDELILYLTRTGTHSDLF